MPHCNKRDTHQKGHDIYLVIVLSSEAAKAHSVICREDCGSLRIHRELVLGHPQIAKSMVLKSLI